MANDFSIDLAAERIHDRRTRDYFDEVLGCYASGYYRSAVVMLWSVVVCDLLYKLDSLANGRGDTKAAKILKDIDVKRQQNPKSPAWEEDLLSLVITRSEMLDIGTQLALKNLQQHRHLSAHPVLTENDRLYAPTKEIARAYLRDTLDGLLTKPPMMSARVFDAFMEDLEMNQTALPDAESVHKYVQTKYGGQLSDSVLCSIFHRLWKIVFRIRDARCDANRAVNIRALASLYQMKPSVVMDYIRSEQSHFSDCHFAEVCGTALSAFLSRFPLIFSQLDEAAQLAISDLVKKDHNIHLTAWCLAPSATDHIEKVLGTIPRELELKDRPYSEAITQLRAEGALSVLKKFAIKRYSESANFRTADIRYTRYIKPLVNDFDICDISEFFSACESNDQTYKRSMTAHLDMRFRLEVLGINDFNYDEFPKACKNLQDDQLFSEYKEELGLSESALLVTPD